MDSTRRCDVMKCLSFLLQQAFSDHCFEYFGCSASIVRAELTTTVARKIVLLQPNKSYLCEAFEFCKECCEFSVIFT